MSDASAALAAAWGQAASAWWSLMAGSWTAADAVLRAILEASYEEADITRVNEVEFDVPAGVANLACGDFVPVGAAPLSNPIKGAKGTIKLLQGTAAAGGPPRAKLTVDPVGAETGDYVAALLDTSTTPHTEVGRVVVFVLAP